jgi:membrane-associated phospholipid phosphatase
MSGHAYTAEALRRPSGSARAQRQDAAGPLGIAGLCLLSLVLVWTVAEHLPAAQLKDAVALHDLTLLNRPTIESSGNFLLHMLEPLLFVLWGGALVSIALARGLPRLALAVTGVLCLAPLTSETLKPLLAHPHDSVGGVLVGPASWPSGHSTAALTLVLCAFLVAPARLRPLVACLGAAFAAAVGLSLLILAWHMPSDVLGGYLVATLWAALAVAGLRAAERRWPTATA